MNDTDVLGMAPNVADAAAMLVTVSEKNRKRRGRLLVIAAAMV